jgi:hypothetical protein
VKTFNLIDERVLNNALEHVKATPANGKFQVVIKSNPNKRTVQQNALLWSWYTIIAEHTGTDAEELHEHMKARFLGFRDVHIMGKTYPVINSTKALNKKQFMEFLGAVFRLAASLEIKLPQPNYYGMEKIK